MFIIVIFLIGATGYGAIEIIWRSKTHWTMLLCGGLSILIIFGINTLFHNLHPVFTSIISSAIITVIELIAGLEFNVKRQMNVWDYSEIPINYKGQICLRYSLLWMLLCLCVLILLSSLSQPVKI